MSVLATHWSLGYPVEIQLREEHGRWYATVEGKEYMYPTYEAFLWDWDLNIKY